MNFLFLFLFLTTLKGQDNSLFIDGVAAVVENNIVLKSDLNQMVNMMAIQRGINPNENLNQYIKLKDIVLESMIDQKRVESKRYFMNAERASRAAENLKQKALKKAEELKTYEKILENFN